LNVKGLFRSPPLDFCCSSTTDLERTGRFRIISALEREGSVPRMRFTIELGPPTMGSDEEATTRVVKRESVVTVQRSVSLAGWKTKGVC
jgi:hypothetical protein